MMTNTVDLLAAIGEHLTTVGLPPLASIEIVASTPAPQVTVQLACHQPATLAKGLLAWADTLTQVTAQAWLVPHGDSVHLSVTGRLPGGTPVLVYGALSASTSPIGADLSPGASTTIPLAALRHALATQEAKA